MGLAVADIDISHDACARGGDRSRRRAGIKAVPTGIAHGTVTLVVDGKPFEVTTLRTDVETDGRHAQVAFGHRLAGGCGTPGPDHQRALRRPRTAKWSISSAACRTSRSGIVRFIGDAATRIAEDYLRILRFFRFFAYYGAGRPDADGLRASAAARQKLKTLSAERVWSETEEAAFGAGSGRAPCSGCGRSAVLTEILPETEKWGIDAIPALVATEQALGWAPDPLLRLAAIVPPDLERLATLSERLKLSKAEAARLQAWAKAPSVKDDLSAAAFDRLLYRNGADGIASRLKLALALARGKAVSDFDEMARAARLSNLLERAEKWKKPVFPVNGADALEAGLPAGPRVGETLGKLEEQWVEGNFALDRATLVARLKELAGG